MLPLDPYTSRNTVSQSVTKIASETWHVAVSWDDIKLMSVDQLDDAFRLEIINSKTSVWKQGMGDWQPLGVVAGLGADEMEDEEVEIGDSQVEFMLPRAAAPRVPPTPKLSPIAQSSWPPPSTRSIAADPWPAPNTQRNVDAWPQSTRSAATDDWMTPRGAPLYAVPEPVPSANYDAIAPRSTAIPMNVSPVAFTLPPPRRESGGFGRWLLAVAFLGGVLVTLYRNDLLLEGARRLNLEDQYFKAERTLLGGPGFGTMRALQALLGTEKPAPAVAAAQPLTPSQLVAAPEAKAAPVAAPAVAAPPTPPVVETPAPAAPPPVQAAAAVARTLPAPPVHAAPAPKALAAAPAPKAVVAHAAPKTQAAPSKASPVKLDDDGDAPAAAKPAPAKKAVASNDAASKPANHSSVTEGVDMPKSALMDAIGQAAKRKSPKGKNAQYDPLNGEL